MDIVSQRRRRAARGEEVDEIVAAREPTAACVRYQISRRASVDCDRQPLAGFHALDDLTRVVPKLT